MFIQRTGRDERPLVKKKNLLPIKRVEINIQICAYTGH